VMTNQVKYNLLQRKAEKLLPWAQQESHVVIAYSPLAQGMLSGKYTAENVPGGIRKINLLFTRSNMEAAQPLLAALREIAQRYGATCSQIALAWLVHHPNVIAIPGAKNVAQLEENAAAGDIELSEEEFHRLTKSSDSFLASRAGVGALPQVVGRLVRG